jgi:adenylylsulfate kinase
MINVLTQDKERLLNQHARVIWMTGLSGAGKTTIARGLEKELLKKGYLSQVIDGDDLRAGLNKDLGFSNEDRKENLRRIAEISRLFIKSGVIAINSFISPTHDGRSMAKSIVGEDYYIEVFINAPLEVCEQRDSKGLYRKARQGLIKDFTGIDSPFEPPQNADIEILTDRLTIKESVDKLLSYILPLVEHKK